jgi:hypothetical protein
MDINTTPIKSNHSHKRVTIASALSDASYKHQWISSSSEHHAHSQGGCSGSGNSKVTAADFRPEVLKLVEAGKLHIRAFTTVDDPFPINKSAVLQKALDAAGNSNPAFKKIYKDVMKDADQLKMAHTFVHSHLYFLNY